MNRRLIVLVCPLVVLSAGCALSSPSSDALDGLVGLDGSDVTDTAPANSVADITTTSVVSDTERVCDEQDLATKSYRPDPDSNVDDAFVAEIRDRGQLVVAVDQNTLGFSVWNSDTGDYEGFEVDLAREIAGRIFGAAYDPATSIRFVPVASSLKRAVVRDHSVDLTISANTMTCERWEDVAFSSEYYTANQEFLVREDSGIYAVDDLAGARVCVTSPSSSQDILDEHVPDAELVLVDERIDCLVELQEGRADAYFGHDSFQYGMKEQQAGLDMRPILPEDVTESHYGIAIALEHEGFVRFVNDVLADVRENGRWQELYQQLRDRIDGIPPAITPQVEYRD